MATSTSYTIVDLVPREALPLRDIRGTTLRVTRGTLWITQQDDTQDIVLRPGDVWVVERDGLTLVEAQSAATLVAGGAAFGRAVGAAPRSPAGRVPLWRRIFATASAWLTLAGRRTAPYF